jgi:hypothetical protein
MKTLFTLFLFLLIPLSASAVVFEVDLDFGYDKQIYGVDRQNSIVSRTYSGGLSTYLFNLTAIDINVSRTLDKNTQNDRYTVATARDVVSDQSSITTDVYGIGIKQMFAGRSAFLTPILSVGYAKEFVEYTRDVTVEDTTNSTRETINLGTTKQRIDSMFGAFILQLKMTDRLSLKGSVKTLIPAFDFNKAKDNLKYSVGLSWIF